LQKFYKRRVTVFNEQNLKEEFADVVITTLLLAKSMNLDINECLKLKLDKIKNRGGI
jgi:NTP pyrophosphatase (non-canonical NTP hydrolase)